MTEQVPTYEQLKLENERLKAQLFQQQQQQQVSPDDQEYPLSLDEYARYGRQMIVPQFGIKGQLRVKNAAVLVVGAGGLGCPALAYLAGAGVGCIGIVDGDIVDTSNLHRQIIHNSDSVGLPKVESARRYINKLNPNINVITYNTHVYAANIFGIISDRSYELVLDCTDNPATRYLVNDACVLTRTPLVSASALKTEGQLSVLNFAGGPCYRCLFPIPPPPNSVVSCGDGGILGPVVGIMGVHQAIEALKLLTSGYDAPGAGDDTGVGAEFKPFLTLFSAYSFPQWRTMKMRGRKPACAVCGEQPSISRQLIETGGLDYREFCGGHANIVRADEATERVSVQEYKRVLDAGTPHLLVDVRVKEQFDICALPNSIHIPYAQLQKGKLEQQLKEPVYVVCRYGNDSQGSVKEIKKLTGLEQVFDIRGGLNKWALEIDNTFPRY